MEKRVHNSVHYQYNRQNSNMASTVAMYIIGYIQQGCAEWKYNFRMVKYITCVIPVLLFFHHAIRLRFDNVMPVTVTYSSMRLCIMS